MHCLLQALSWTFYELMRHPEVEQKVAAEVKQVLGAPPQHSNGSAVKPSYDQIRQLRYTRACFMEALRLHPSVPEVGDLGIAPLHGCQQCMWLSLDAAQISVVASLAFDG
jgi:hypothetical protein